jgi:hypothetical protein
LTFDTSFQTAFHLLQTAWTWAVFLVQIVAARAIQRRLQRGTRPDLLARPITNRKPVSKYYLTVPALTNLLKLDAHAVDKYTVKASYILFGVGFSNSSFTAQFTENRNLTLCGFETIGLVG